MRQSSLFTNVERSAPKGETAENAKLLQRAGFIYKNSAGVYSYLPLGWRVIQNIAGIIREEMKALGGQEIFMPALVERKYLEATGRWDVPIGFDVRGKKDDASSFGLGWTHEEIMTVIAAKFIHSYKNLPFAAYQIQTKFRNEPRAKSGLLRGREFIMKDLYSFHASEDDFMNYYNRVGEAYQRIFGRSGLTAVLAVALGGEFTAGRTHEFQVISPAGEDTIYLCRDCAYAENREISKLKNGGMCPKCNGKMAEEKSIEVGNIFPLGDRYSKSFHVQFSDKDGTKKYVMMGSYGIGLSRLMAAAVEVHHDKDGILWPESIAPFSVHLLELEGASAAKVYRDLQKAGIDVLYDERKMSPGEKFIEADLLGIPWRAVVSSKTGAHVEMKRRGEREARLVSPGEIKKIMRYKS